MNSLRARRIVLPLVITLAGCCAASLASGETLEQERPSPIRLEIVPGFDSDVPIRLGTTVSLAVDVINVTDEGVALCWSSTRDARFLSHRLVDISGAEIELRRIPGEIHRDYAFELTSNVIILPAGSRQLVHLVFDTRALPRTTACTTYRVGASYWCPRVAADRWAAEVPIVLDALAETMLEIVVDDRPWWNLLLKPNGCVQK